MEVFRENAQVLRNAVAKRRMAATLVRKEPRSQVRIFNTVFTIEGSSDEEDNETRKKRKEKEKILESVIQARIEQKEAEERQKENEEVDAKINEFDADRDPFGELFEVCKNNVAEYLSSISESEDECEIKRGQTKKQIMVCNLVDEEIKEIQPWIVAPPLPVGDEKPETREKEIQTEFVFGNKVDRDSNTEFVEKEVRIF
ncbi:hypothetical protein FO519_006340 [Halicephalobus sp. NKZ332]|nr:hypothetical protein FO519_006340 [Halicephalobus sp. NKZ332]